MGRIIMVRLFYSVPRWMFNYSKTEVKLHDNCHVVSFLIKKSLNAICLYPKFKH